MNIKDFSMNNRDNDIIEALHELEVVERAKSQCKWHEFGKKTVYRAYADLIKFMNDI